MQCNRFMLIATVLVTLLVASCQQLSPEEKVARERALYTAELNSFSVPDAAVDEDEGIEEEAAATEEEGDEAAADTEKDGDEGEMAPAEPLVTVYLDVLLSTESMDPLPGVTLDVSHVDAQQNEKQHHRMWVDTTDLVRGSGIQVTLTLEDAPYVEGDGFAVEVRPVPPDERSQYREFDVAP